MELSKSQKKIARTLIETGLQREFAKGLSGANAIIEEWKEKKSENRESYHQLFRFIDKFDHHIARRYDRMSGSNYLFIIAAQVHDGFISDDELKEFPDEIISGLNILLGRE